MVPDFKFRIRVADLISLRMLRLLNNYFSILDFSTEKWKGTKDGPNQLTLIASRSRFFLKYHRQKWLNLLHAIEKLLKQRMTMATDNNEVRRREANLFECQSKERPGFVQEKSSTGHSCNPWTKPLLSSFRFRVDGWR